MIAGDQEHMPRQLVLRLNLDDEATFDNFFRSSEDCRNSQLLQFLRESLIPRVAAGPVAGAGTVLRDFVWLCGEKGAGCSHLLQAVCHAVTQQGLQAFYLDFSVQMSLSPDVLQGMEYVSILCLDSIDRLAGNDEWELALFSLYNRMAEQQTPLLVASHSSPAQLAFNLPDLKSRMQSAAVFELEALSDDDKAKALQLRARQRGFELSDEVAAYLVSRSERSMNALSDVLQQLDQHSLETKRKVTVPLLKSLMGW